MEEESQLKDIQTVIGSAQLSSITPNQAWYAMMMRYLVQSWSSAAQKPSMRPSSSLIATSTETVWRFSRNRAVTPENSNITSKPVKSESICLFQSHFQCSVSLET